MRFVRKKELIRDYFVIILFIACSDAIFWKGVLSAAVTYPLLLVVAYVNFICKKGITINKLSFLYILGCGCLCGINYFVTVKVCYVYPAVFKHGKDHAVSEYRSS